MTTVPATIFKYESFTLRAIQNLKRQSVHFGSPKGFNDPYDCAITASIADPTPDQVETVKQYYLTASDTNDALKKLLTTLPPDQLKRTTGPRRTKRRKRRARKVLVRQRRDMLYRIER